MVEENKPKKYDFRYTRECVSCGKRFTFDFLSDYRVGLVVVRCPDCHYKITEYKNSLCSLCGKPIDGMVVTDSMVGNCHSECYKKLKDGD